jgi:hypothetical protein
MKSQNVEKYSKNGKNIFPKKRENERNFLLWGHLPDI